jgi:hypothetical protein
MQEQVQQSYPNSVLSSSLTHIVPVRTALWIAEELHDMVSLRRRFMLIFCAYAFAISNAVEFTATPTKALRESATFGVDHLSIVTAAAFHHDLKQRATDQGSSICGWIEGNGGKNSGCVT